MRVSRLAVTHLHLYILRISVCVCVHAVCGVHCVHRTPHSHVIYEKLPDRARNPRLLQCYVRMWKWLVCCWQAGGCRQCVMRKVHNVERPVRKLPVHFRGCRTLTRRTGCRQNVTQVCTEEQHQKILFGGSVFFILVFSVGIC